MAKAKRAAEYLVSVDLVVIAESEEQAEQHVRDKVLGDTYGLSSEITYTEHMRDLPEGQ